MFKKMKRAISAILAVVLMLSVMVPCVMAAGTETYSFLYKEDVFPNVTGNVKLTTEANAKALSDAYEAGSINSMPIYYGIPDGQNPYATDATLSAGGVVGSWMAIKFKSPGSGKYSVEITHKRESTSPTFGIYILAGDTKEEAISNCTALTSEALLGEHNFYTTEPITAGNFKFEGDQEYIIVFKITALKSGKDAGVFRLISMNMELQEAYEAKIVNAEGNTTYYDTAENAFSAAENASSSTPVQLLDDVTVEEALTVPAGVTLDLNGYTLTAGSVVANFDGTNIVDGSSGDTGVLKVTGNMVLNEANSELPLKDNDKGGYRFFEATVNSLGKTGTEQNKFWFKVSFTNEDAYALAASQMDIGAGLTATEITVITEAWAGFTFAEKWSAAIAGSQPSDICFTAKNFSGLTNFKLTPMVKANGVTVSGVGL